MTDASRTLKRYQSLRVAREMVSRNDEAVRTFVRNYTEKLEQAEREEEQADRKEKAAAAG